MSGEETRREIKFVTEPGALPRIEAWIRSRPEAFREAYPARVVSNVYFDTFECRSFAENLLGGGRRAKVRYRWYGNSPLPSSGRLEVKRRRGAETTKAAFAVSLPDGGAPLRWSELARRISGAVPPEARLWLSLHPAPVLINRYRRRYFESRDGAIRITIDTDPEFYDQRFLMYPNTDRRERLDPVVVVEIKARVRDSGLAAALARSIPVRHTRYSKYVQGVALIRGR